MNLHSIVKQEPNREFVVDLFVIFQLEAEIFGAPVLQIREVIKQPEITKIPQSETYVEGIISIRGRVIPVINLKRKLELGDQFGKSAKILIVEFMNTSVGLIVDSVEEVVRFAQEDIQSVRRLACVDNRYIGGIAYHREKMVVLLSLEAIFNEKEKDELLMLTAGEDNKDKGGLA